MGKILYYVFLVPLSLLPLKVLYAIGGFLRFIVFDVVGYRKGVILQNLQRSFPEKSPREIKKIARKFYVHFTDVFAEGFKGFTISKRELLKRYKVENPELVEKYYKDGRSVILVSGHYNNWEFMVQSLDLLFSFAGVGVGQKITHEGFAGRTNNARTRFGMTIWRADNVRNRFNEYLGRNELFACMLLSDQSPSNVSKAFWMRFLNQDTPVLFGPEYLSKKHNLPVLFYHVKKLKRGYYSLKFDLVTDAPALEGYGDITYRHNKMLEKVIRESPSEWLWSHKKWKHGSKSAQFEVRL